MKALMRTCVLALSAGSVVVAQQPPQTPMFRSGVSLVTVDVTVVDKNGVPIADLTEVDFVARINGKERPVQTLDFLRFGASVIGDSPQAVGSATTRAPVSRGAPTFMLVFDDLSFSPGAGKGMPIAGERLLKQLDVGAMVGVIATSGRGPNVSPTRDRGTVRKALASLVGTNVDSTAPFFIGIHEAIDIERGFVRDALSRVADRECPIVFPGLKGDGCPSMVKSRARVRAVEARQRVEQQLSSFHQIVAAMAQAPAPRVVVVMTAGVSLGAELNMRDPIEALRDAAAAAGVQLYALVDEGDLVDMNDTEVERTTVRRLESRTLSEGMMSVAAATGGQAFRVVGQADQFLARVVSETSAIYRLGIEVPEAPTGTSSLRAEVTVRRSGVTVRNTGRALAAAPSLSAAAPSSRDEQMKMRLAQGGNIPFVPVRVATRVRRHNGQALQIMVDARLPATVQTPVSLLFGLVDSTGNMVFAGTKALPGPPSSGEHHVLFPISAPAGTYRLRFVAGDSADQIGSVEIPVVAGLTPMGGFDVSDLMTVFPGSDGRNTFSAFEDVHLSAEEVVASVEIYQTGTAAPGPDSRVQFVLTAADDDGPIIERSTTLASSTDRWTASAAMTLTGLEPGRYVIRATLKQGDVSLGSVTRRLVK